jgi:hypothetical protein
MKDNYYNIGLSNNPDEWVYSNSSLSLINPSQGGHPLKLVSFFTENNEEERALSLERGKLIHLYMENPEGFAISSVPKPSDKLAIAADNLIADLLTATDTIEITDEMILANVRNVGWNSKWGDEAILKNTKDGIKSYVQEVLANKDKHILSESTAKTVQSCIKAINENELINVLITPCVNETVYTEHTILWESRGFKRKAKLDRFHVDLEAKVIRHFDYKSSGGSIMTFEGTFESYRYYRQFAYYEEALNNFIAITLNQNPDDWKIHHYVIVIETTEPFATTVYEVTSFWLEEGRKEIAAIDNILNIHYKANNFKQTYQEIQSYGFSTFRDVRNKEAWY